MKIRLIIISLFITSVLSAQRFTVVAGNIRNVKGISEYNVAFDYSNIKVYDFETEEAY